MFDVDCTHLRVGQFICPSRLDIDVHTQQPFNCSQNNTAPITCHLIDGLRCQENVSSNRLNDTHFIMQQSCQFTEGHSFQTTLLLAVFLGMFGADRFYLGYYAIGLLKFCTFGFMLVGQLLDIILIVTQVLRPASGAYYVIDYFGPKMNITSLPT
jgi:TM2 domain-containing membrane protein YozV